MYPHTDILRENMNGLLIDCRGRCNATWEAEKSTWYKGRTKCAVLSLSSVNFNCPNPVDASSLLKDCAFASWAMISSLVGNLECSHLIASLRSLGSRHLCNWPLCFCTSTNEPTQSVGSSVLWMTCKSAIISSSVYLEKQTALYCMGPNGMFPWQAA